MHNDSRSVSNVVIDSGDVYEFDSDTDFDVSCTSFVSNS